MHRRPYRRSALLSALVLFCTGVPVSAGLFDWFKKGKAEPAAATLIEPVLPASNDQSVDGPRVLTVAPSGRVNDAGENLAVTVTFDRPMTALTALPTEEATGPLTFEPEIKGKYRWYGVNTLVFTPAAPLPAGERFLATIPAGLKSADGKQTARPYRWTFDTARPQFQASEPYQGSRFVALDPTLILFFNLPMDPKRARDFFDLRARPTTDLFGEVGGFDAASFTQSFDVDVRALTPEEHKRHQWRAPDIRQALVVTPSRKLPREHTFALVMKAGLPSATGRLGLERDTVFGFKTYNNFRLVSVKEAFHPAEGLSFVFSNPVRNDDLRKALSFEPKLNAAPEKKAAADEAPEDEGYGGYHSHEQTVYLPFTARQTYRALISKKLKDQFDQTLADDVDRTILCTSWVPWMSIPTGTVTVEAKLRHRLPLDVINLASIRRLLKPLDVKGAIALLSAGLHTVTDAPSEVQKLPLQLNQSRTLPIELDDALGKDGRGFLFVRAAPNETLPGLEAYPLGVFARERASQVQSAFVQVTNLAITAKSSPENLLVWVTYLSSARPVKGATVTLLDDAGKVHWTGTTNDAGWVRAPGWAMLSIAATDRWRHPRVWVTAETKGDRAIAASNWGTGIYPYDFGLAYEYRQIHPTFTGHVFTDRGLYQAGETVQLKGVFREKRDGEWVVSALKKVVMTISDSRGEEVKRVELAVNKFGSFSTDLPLAREAVTGFYSVSVVDPSLIKKTDGDEEDEYQPADGRLRVGAGFRVEAFRPAKFETLVRLDKDVYKEGEEAVATVTGRYLFGAPMKNAAAVWGARLWETDFAPEGFESYSFGRQRYIDGNEWTPRSLELKADGGKLNERGEIEVRLPLKNPSGFIGAMSLQTEATVTDADREQISGRASALVHLSDYYLGLKASTTFIERGKPVTVTAVAVTPEGKPVAGRAVDVKLIRREWNSVRKAGVGGRAAWVVEQVDVPVSSATLTSTDAAVSTAFTPEKAGYYLVRAESFDDARRPTYADLTFYVTGRDYVPWARSDDDRIELIADKRAYKPGETASILVKSPFEEAQALVTIERENVIDQFVTRLVGSADTVRIPLVDHHVPNVFVSVSLIQGRTAENTFTKEGDDAGRPAFKIGYLNLPVDPGTRRLKVSVASDRKEYRPRERVTVDFTVLDHEGRPRAAECAVSVADRGILNLIGFRTPDSFDAFYGPRPLSVETVESRLHVIGQRSYGEKGENRGGGGMDGALLSDADLRSKFRGTAFWNGHVVTDADGKGQVTFELPDDLTGFKIMVTANTPDSRFGAGDSEFKVKKPLMLKPALPRFARLGDMFRAGVTVHNGTGGDGTVLVAANAAGATMTASTGTRVEVKNGESREVIFDYAADRLGTAVLRFGAGLAAEKDGLKMSLPVILPRVTEAVAYFNNTTSSAAIPVALPGNIYPEAGGLEIEAASTAMIGLKDGIRYLEAYPYECLEQKVSRVLPFLQAGDVLEAFGLTEFKGARKKEAVEKVLAELPRFQKPNGAFGFWPDSVVPSEYLTAYVVYFLAEARRNGYAVNPAVVGLALDFLQTAANSPDQAAWNYPYSANARLAAKAFIVYALGLWERPQHAAISRLCERVGDIPLFGRAYLLKAIHLGKMNPALGDAVAQSLFNSIKEDPVRAHFEEQDPSGLDWIFDSPARTTAFILQSMLEVGRDFPQAPKCVRWLMDARKSGRWRTTQENLYVFHALATYFRIYEADEPDFTARVQLAGKTALEALFQGRAVEPKVVTQKWSALPIGSTVTAVASKEGTGRLYYNLRMIYAPKGDLPAREEGLSIKREMTLEDGKPLPAVLAAGTKVLVKLTVTSPFDRTFVVAEDPLPAGFQIVNTSFDTASRKDGETAASGTSTRWWGGFNHREMYDDRAVFVADYLDRGTHTLSYLAVAGVRGRFSQPPAKTEGMYTPEVFGRTASGSLVIE